MLKKFFLLSLIIPFLFIGQPVVAEKAKPEVPVQIMAVEAKPVDTRVLILHDYLAKYNSPLQDNAGDFIEAADMYNVDWKLVPSIAGVESTFGKQTPGGFNGWGWGVYGNQALGFKSWKDGIFTVTQGLKENYIDKGLTDPYAMNRAYAASQAWGGHVTYFMNDLDKFAQAYDVPKSTEVTLSSYPQSGATALNAQERVSPSAPGSIWSLASANQ